MKKKKSARMGGFAVEGSSPPHPLLYSCCILSFFYLPPPPSILPPSPPVFLGLHYYGNPFVLLAVRNNTLDRKHRFVQPHSQLDFLCVRRRLSETTRSQRSPHAGVATAVVAVTVSSKAAELGKVFGCSPEGHNTAMRSDPPPVPLLAAAEHCFLRGTSWF